MCKSFVCVINMKHNVTKLQQQWDQQRSATGRSTGKKSERYRDTSKDGILRPAWFPLAFPLRLPLPFPSLDCDSNIKSAVPKFVLLLEIGRFFERDAVVVALVNCNCMTPAGFVLSLLVCVCMPWLCACKCPSQSTLSGLLVSRKVCCLRLASLSCSSIKFVASLLGNRAILKALFNSYPSHGFVAIWFMHPDWLARITQSSAGQTLGLHSPSLFLSLSGQTWVCCIIFHIGSTTNA